MRTKKYLTTELRGTHAFENAPEQEIVIFGMQLSVCIWKLIAVKAVGSS
jgi:hypothetical protein